MSVYYLILPGNGSYRVVPEVTGEVIHIEKNKKGKMYYLALKITVRRSY